MKNVYLILKYDLEINMESSKDMETKSLFHYEAFIIKKLVLNGSKLLNGGSILFIKI